MFREWHRIIPLNYNDVIDLIIQNAIDKIAWPAIFHVCYQLVVIVNNYFLSNFPPHDLCRSKIIIVFYYKL